MKLSKEQLSRSIKASVNILFTFSGIGAIGYGAWLVYPPSAFIVVGVSLFYLGLPDR